eukprot:Amastigsp_a762_29.p2 type:complete len:307 gc:universal Amastigsp_a762_29:432-1352(+)
MSTDAIGSRALSRPPAAATFVELGLRWIDLCADARMQENLCAHCLVKARSAFAPVVARREREDVAACVERRCGDGRRLDARVGLRPVNVVDSELAFVIPACDRAVLPRGRERVIVRVEGDGVDGIHVMLHTVRFEREHRPCVDRRVCEMHRHTALHRADDDGLVECAAHHRRRKVKVRLLHSEDLVGHVEVEHNKALLIGRRRAQNNCKRMHRRHRSDSLGHCVLEHRCLRAAVPEPDLAVPPTGHQTLQRRLEEHATDRRVVRGNLSRLIRFKIPHQPRLIARPCEHVLAVGRPAHIEHGRRMLR